MLVADCCCLLLLVVTVYRCSCVCARPYSVGFVVALVCGCWLLVAALLTCVQNLSTTAAQSFGHSGHASCSHAPLVSSQSGMSPIGGHSCDAWCSTSKHMASTVCQLGACSRLSVVCSRHWGRSAAAVGCRGGKPAAGHCRAMQRGDDRQLHMPSARASARRARGPLLSHRLCRGCYCLQLPDFTTACLALPTISLFFLASLHFLHALSIHVKMLTLLTC